MTQKLAANFYTDMAHLSVKPTGAFGKTFVI
jgi:hypothetical protein